MQTCKHKNTPAACLRQSGVHSGMAFQLSETWQRGFSKLAAVDLALPELYGNVKTFGVNS